jgi:CRISPR-associated protein Csx17
MEFRFDTGRGRCLGERSCATARNHRPWVSCSPFSVRARAIGYGSAEAGDEDVARAEIWMPTWERPARYEEFRVLLREGRVEWSGRPVNNGLEFAKAAASLGTGRGITAFVRYSLLKRRGDSFVALPIGRVPVHERKDSDLLQELDQILDAVDRFARGFKSNSPPAQFASRRRQIDATIYEFALHGRNDSSRYSRRSGDWSNSLRNEA